MNIVRVFVMLMPLIAAHEPVSSQNVQPKTLSPHTISDKTVYTLFAWRKVGSLWVKHIPTTHGDALVLYEQRGADERFTITFECVEQFTHVLPPLYVTISWRGGEHEATITGCLAPGRIQDNTRYRLLFEDLPNNARSREE